MSYPQASLSPAHRDMLARGSGIAAEVIRARGYRTVTAEELDTLGFGPRQCRPGLLLPLHAPDGSSPFAVLRPDHPREVADKVGRVTVIKYELPQGERMRLDCPPVCRAQLADPSEPLWVTEGQKKADALASQRLCAIALLGVWNFKGRNDAGGTVFLADWDYIALDDRVVYLVFDSDVMTKPQVRLALERLTEHLQRKGAHVHPVYLPGGQGGKVGVDDYLVQGHTLAELEALADAPRPTPTAAAPRVQMLDQPPRMLRRPLALLDGVAYAAIWPYVQVTVTESLSKTGQVIVHRPPLTKTEQRLFVIRSDGRLYGDGDGYAPLTELPLLIALPEIPPPERLWSRRGVARYAAGKRPDPVAVWSRVCDVADRFIDFSRSLAPQRTLAEMVGCYILATWFLDAFNVIGFLWPNGDRGCGKTQLLHVICELAYLGQVILAGGSYASLRDMADYGATLAFDDAENMDVKTTDPDKRALLLAGNRRGSSVSVKELAADKTWRTRYVNAFCPRLFSAIKCPDPVLASRTIVVPLIRTADRDKGNADPLDYSLWPHDRRALLDELWALALAHLPEIGAYEPGACAGSRLQGRNLEPWRALLTVAAWLEAQGAAGLYGRLEELSYHYQQEREQLESTDITALLLRAIASLVTASSASSASTASNSELLLFSSSEIAERLQSLAEEEEVDLSWMGEGRMINTRVGRQLGRLRFEQQTRTNAKGPRRWRIVVEDLEARLLAYGLAVPERCKKRETSEGDLSKQPAELSQLAELAVPASPSPDAGEAAFWEAVECAQLCDKQRLISAAAMAGALDMGLVQATRQLEAAAERGELLRRPYGGEMRYEVARR